MLDLDISVEGLDQLIMKYPNNHGCRCSCGSRNLILEQL